MQTEQKIPASKVPLPGFRLVCHRQSGRRSAYPATAKYQGYFIRHYLFTEWIVGNAFDPDGWELLCFCFGRFCPGPENRRFRRRAASRSNRIARHPASRAASIESGSAAGSINIRWNSSAALKKPTAAVKKRNPRKGVMGKQDFSRASTSTTPMVR